ncbi:hypothetical protein [Paraliobacillus sp. X-1268]|uniref:hypothetical protein n=1 Tax=Paraliobacillus sp. X-1268 TaxID=2213193 RepID=UPI000E3CCCCB|nr:hypothetical protein [Paraliobacillus sp. X-1268]
MFPLYKMSLACFIFNLFILFFPGLMLFISPMFFLSGILLGIGAFIAEDKIGMSILATTLNILYMVSYIIVIDNL